MRGVLPAVLFLLADVPAGSQEIPPGWFEFAIPGLDASPTPTDLSRLNPAPAGAGGFVRVQDGHFADGEGRRLRFLGVNMTANACFPDKAVAPKVAAHLRKLGFNVVRFHFMDVGGPPSGIFQKDGKSLDPGQLDRLDFFIAQLKAHGIHANLNLHVARRYPGLTEEARRRFQWGKVLDRFYPPFLEMQREYARDLLTHRNPYTGNAYTEEPAVLCVELNNENTMLPFWGGNVENLPEPYGGELDRQWRDWLRTRYGSTDRLRAAWRDGEVPLGGELLRDGEFREGPARWVVQAAGGAEAKGEALSGDLPAGVSSALRWTASKAGTAGWHLQLFQGGLSLEEGRPYTLSFWSRSPRGAPPDLEVVVMQEGEPWHGIGLGRVVPLGASWVRHQFLFRARGVGGRRARVNFSTRNRTGVVDLAGVSLREGGVFGLAAGRTIDDLRWGEAGGTPAARRDAMLFLMETEQAGTRGLVRFLKKELGLRSLVADTQADYGQAAGLVREGTLGDYQDMHGYWEHPEFPGGNWDRANWRIRNTTQAGAADGGTLGHIAAYRLAGKPLSVSEYNTPAPNDHAAESLAMLSAIAAFQDWDAIYHYTYLDFRTEWEADRILSYFDLCGHAGQTAFAPVAALVFRRGLVRPGGTPVRLTLPKGAVPALMAEGKGDVVGLWEEAGVPRGSAGRRRLEVVLADGTGEVRSSERVGPAPPCESDTGEISWEAAEARFRVRAPAVRMAVGKIAGERLELGDVFVEVGRLERGYACLALVALDGRPVAESRAVLLAAAARVENRGMGWNADRTSVSTAWGRGPAIAEAVPAEIFLPGSGWKARALDGTGAPRGELPVGAAGGKSAVRIGAVSPSLWYLLSRD